MEFLGVFVGFEASQEQCDVRKFDRRLAGGDGACREQIKTYFFEVSLWTKGVSSCKIFIKKILRIWYLNLLRVAGRMTAPKTMLQKTAKTLSIMLSF